MRVLGVDPGLTRCGIGVVSRDARGTLHAVAVQVLRTPADDRPERRLATIAAGIESAIAEHRVDVLAVEQVFAQANLRSVMGTAQVAGLAMVAASRAGIPVALHTPSEVKAAVTGSGRAPKAQVQEMVKRILRLAERPKPADAADALALAICHAWRQHVVGAGSGAVAMARDSAEHGALTPAQLRWAEAERSARRPAAGRRLG